MADWTTGERLGPYELMLLIGTGGMGEVWKARDTRLDRIVAIKRLKAAHADRFQREARAIAALNHPHICQLYDVGPDYLVMEYVEGVPLKGPLELGDALPLAIQMASALDAAHRKGIVHRDLKPANVLLSAEGVKLLDFGLAKLVEADSSSTMTRAGMVMGTPDYMSPEQVEGQTVDERSDVFSFGAVLYELLSGRRAFEGLSGVLRDEPAPLQSAAADIVRRCVAKKSQQRFQTMAELKEALTGLAEKPADRQPSIAVLPFADMSPSRDHEYFSDGLAEEIINVLAQIPGLKVIARTSAFAFKGQNTDVRRIAETLGVTNILEGSVRKAGDRIRVTAQLITAADGSHLWSERYDRELTDVFAIQDQIATAIASALRVKLALTPRRYVPNIDAYEAYLRGRHHWSKLTPESLARSRECYEQAVALDPQFALARNALAEHFFALAGNGLMPGREAALQVRTGAAAALKIDPTLAEAHALLGLVAATVEYDWKEAAREFELAMARQPIPPYVRWLRSQQLAQVFRYREAVEECESALREDPLHLLCRSHLAEWLYVSERRGEAMEQLRKVLAVDERFWIAQWYLGLFEALQGNLVEARAAAEKALTPWNTMTMGLLAGVAARLGDAARADELLAQLRSASPSFVPTGWSVYHLIRLQADEAVDWLGKAIEQRDPRAFYLVPYVRSSSRWPGLAKLLNYPESGANALTDPREES